MLTADRPEMAKRAVRAFRAQAYQNKRLLVFVTDESHSPEVGCNNREFTVCDERLGGASIGVLRNAANGFIYQPWCPPADIIVHWDDDDWSHPNRIAEQVAALQASEAEITGYSEALFWDTRRGGGCGQAWRYRGPRPIGSSLCYWRRAWERKPFPDLPKPGAKEGTTEDNEWLRGQSFTSYSAATGYPLEPRTPLDPRMICAIHGQNSQRYNIEDYPENWRRVPAWDAYCSATMRLQPEADKGHEQ